MISNLFSYFFGNAEGFIDKTAFWTFALVIVTVFLMVIAIRQLSNIKKTAKADYIKRLNDTFFTSNTRNMLTLLFNSAIEFSNLSIKDSEGEKEIDKLPCFKIKKFVSNQLKSNGIISIEEWREGYNAFEIDDLLLGPLDDVGRFEKNGLIDTDTAYSTFGYYICQLVGDNRAVMEFLEDEESEGNYDDLEYIFEVFDSYYAVREKSWWRRKLWDAGHLMERWLIDFRSK